MINICKIDHDQPITKIDRLIDHRWWLCLSNFDRRHTHHSNVDISPPTKNQSNTLLESLSIFTSLSIYLMHDDENRRLPPPFDGIDRNWLLNHQSLIIDLNQYVYRVAFPFSLSRSKCRQRIKRKKNLQSFSIFEVWLSRRSRHWFKICEKGDLISKARKSETEIIVCVRQILIDPFPS